MSEKEEKDFTILAYPKKNQATVESNTANAMVFMNRKFSSTKPQAIQGEQVNSLLAELRTNNFSFDFILGKQQE